MRFTVKLFAYFRDNRFRAEVRDYPEGTRWNRLSARSVSTWRRWA